MNGKEVGPTGSLRRSRPPSGNGLRSTSGQGQMDRSRTVMVEPIASEDHFRNRDWVEGNLKKVEEATGGRVGHVYVRDTAGTGMPTSSGTSFPRPTGRRSSTSGSTAAGRSPTTTSTSCAGRFELLGDPTWGRSARPTRRSWAQGDDHRRTAGSGGDLLPWMFRKFKLGPLVGKRTWGGLVGILGFPAHGRRRGDRP